MPFLTKEDYDLLPEGIRERIQKAEQDFDAGIKTRDELQGAITKIFSNPKTKKMFEQMNKEANLGLNIPVSPIDAYVEPLEKEIQGLKDDKKKEYEAETKKLCQAKFEELSIPFTKEKADEIEKYRLSHHIQDSREGYLESITQWAEHQEPEPVSAEYTKPFSFKEAPNEEKAMEGALADIRQFKKSMIGRR